MTSAGVPCRQSSVSSCSRSALGHTRQRLQHAKRWESVPAGRMYRAARERASLRYKRFNLCNRLRPVWHQFNQVVATNRGNWLWAIGAAAATTSQAVPCCLQERAKQLAVQFRQLLQQLHVTASSSWRGSVKAAVNAAVAHHKKQHSSEAAAADGVGDTMPAAAAAALEETDREQLFRQYVSELSRQEARCVCLGSELFHGSTLGIFRASNGISKLSGMAFNAQLSPVVVISLAPWGNTLANSVCQCVCPGQSCFMAASLGSCHVKHAVCGLLVR
jgi:hypothetical protein